MRDLGCSEASGSAVPAAEMAHPLDQFYARSGSALPPLEAVDPAEVPEPYRSLLVHDQDMTSTLEQFHGGPVTLQVLGRHQAGEVYYREVVLRLVATQQPVEFGAIKIFLDRFPEEARRMILEEHWPLGRILKETRMGFVSAPRLFLRLASDRLISEVLQLGKVKVLYGRRNVLSDEQGRCLAEIVEILPAMAVPGGPEKVPAPTSPGAGPAQ